MPLLIALLVLISGLCSESLADRSARFLNPEADTLHQNIVVNSLDVQFDGDDVILSWEALLNRHPDRDVYLSNYHVCTGNNPSDLHLYLTTLGTTIRIRNLLPFRGRYFQVYGHYGSDSRQKSPMNRARRDDRYILDFEDEEELDLRPYSEEENRDDGLVGITDEESLPGSDNSLRLGQNTWQKMDLERAILTDSTVWSIGVLSQYNRNRIQDLHAFGIADGTHELLYVFSGNRLYWDHDWVVSYQDVFPRGEWHEFKLAVGYDWKIRYGYLPSIDELIFVCDNDNNNIPMRVYFDDLMDLTEDILPKPIPKLRWRERDDVDVDGYPIAFTCDIDNRDLEDIESILWDFGDGNYSSDQYPTHVFTIDGVYTVGVSVTDEAGRIGHKTIDVEVGHARTPNLISACFTGDVMLARRYENQGGLIRQNGPEAVFEIMRPRFLQSDLNAINLESLLTDDGERHPSKSIVFRGSPDNITGLTYANIHVAILANNHVIDYGLEGLLETQNVLDAAGILHCGAGMNEEEALEPTFKTVNGIRVGFLSYCNRTGRDYNERPFMDAGYDRYGYAYFSADNLQRSVPPAAAACDLLVIYLHGGWEYAIAPTSNNGFEEDPQFGDMDFHIPEVDSATRELEHMAIDLGAGLIIAGHPHVLQGFEVYNDVVIAHSLGNFAFDQNFFETWPSAIVSTDIGQDGVVNAFVEPIFVNRYVPTPATGALGRKIIDRVAGYSYDINAILVPEYNRMRARIVKDNDRVHYREREFTVSGEMRYLEEEGVYRSQPMKLDGGGFPSEIVNIEPFAQDAGWRVSLGRDILLVGDMEMNGADIWDYNSDVEGPTSEIARNGVYSSFLNRQQGWGDGITDLIQRIPVDPENDRLTFGGWLRIINGRDAGIAVRLYSDRYEDRRVGPDQVAERRLQGNLGWTYLWDSVNLPDNADYLNIRWQLFGADEGENFLYADDVEVIRWEDFQEFNDNLGVDFPNDLYYLQVEARRPVEEVTITYRTTTLSYR